MNFIGISTRFSEKKQNFGNNGISKSRFSSKFFRTVKKVSRKPLRLSEKSENHFEDFSELKKNDFVLQKWRNEKIARNAKSEENVMREYYVWGRPHEVVRTTERERGTSRACPLNLHTLSARLLRRHHSTHPLDSHGTYLTLLFHSRSLSTFYDFYECQWTPFREKKTDVSIEIFRWTANWIIPFFSIYSNCFIVE